MKYRTVKCRVHVVALVLLAALSAAAPPLWGQEIAKIIDFGDGDAVPDWQFGMRLSADGSRLFVAICGSYYNPQDNNRRIVAVETAGDTVIGEGQTGLYPEEIELAYGSGGELERVFVSNSSDGTISVLNPDLSFSGLVDLSAAGGSYPFGLILGPLGRYLGVSTLGGDRIFVVDTAAGPTYLAVVGAIAAEGNGRMALHNGRLVIPGSQDVSPYGTQAVLNVAHLDNPGQVDTVVLDDDSAGWPGAYDVAVAGGCAYVPVLDYAGHMLLYEVDLEAPAPAVSRTIDLAGGHTQLWEHGIGASPDGNTLVVTCLDGPCKIVARKAGRLLAEVDLSGFGSGQGNEAVFSTDGSKVYVTDQGDSFAYVLTGVPPHGLFLSGPATAAPGSQVDLELTGGEAGRPGALLASLALGPTVYPGFRLDIGAPFYVLAQGFFDGENALPGLGWTVPAWPWLPGKSIYLQGLAKDGDGEIRPSNLHELTIL